MQSETIYNLGSINQWCYQRLWDDAPLAHFGWACLDEHVTCVPVI